MPKYFYICASCGVEISVYHNMSEICTNCTECGQNNCLDRKPSSFNFVEKINSKKSKTGHVVKKSIEDFREDLKEQKKQLKDDFYEPS